jgi:hypothetical protein
LGGVVLTQGFNNRCVYALRIFQHLVVPQTQNPLAFVLQEAAPLDFLLRRWIVLAAIDFDNQPRLVADKIRYISPERHLAPEPVSAICRDRIFRQRRFSASVMSRRKA